MFSVAAKKKLRSKIALREASEAQADEDLTEEEKASAKMHAMKMEEQAQMSLTRDMFGKNFLLPCTRQDLPTNPQYCFSKMWTLT